MGKKKVEGKSSKIELEDDIEELTAEELKRGSSKKHSKPAEPAIKKINEKSMNKKITEILTKITKDEKVKSKKSKSSLQ